MPAPLPQSRSGTPAQELQFIACSTKRACQARLQESLTHYPELGFHASCKTHAGEEQSPLQHPRLACCRAVLSRLSQPAALIFANATAMGSSAAPAPARSSRIQAESIMQPSRSLTGCLCVLAAQVPTRRGGWNKNTFPVNDAHSPGQARPQTSAQTQSLSSPSRNVRGAGDAQLAAHLARCLLLRALHRGVSWIFALIRHKCNELSAVTGHANGRRWISLPRHLQ